MANTDKVRAYKRAERVRNKERYEERRQRYYAKNAERIRAYNRERYRSKRDYCIAQVRAWEARNPELKRMYSRVQKIRRNSYEYIAVHVLQEVYEDNIRRYGTLTCELCGAPVAFGNDSIDHKIPISRRHEFPGVLINAKENMCVAHTACNARKQRMTFDEWMELRSGSKERV